MTDRALLVDGSVNLRDFGGYATADGRTIRRGQLLRCGTLVHITQLGLEQFEDLNVELVCDLRRPDERAEEPTPLPFVNPNRLEIPIDPGSAVELRQRLNNTGLALQDRVNLMTALTGELTRDHADDYAQMFEGLLGVEDGAFLVHCSAGKDRTGVACALIQHALGVPKETVIEDYLLTNQTLDYEGYIVPQLVARFEPEQAPDKPLVMALAGVREEYLHAAYASIEEAFDGVEHFLEEALGVNDEAKQRLRGRLLI